MAYAQRLGKDVEVARVVGAELQQHAGALAPSMPRWRLRRRVNFCTAVGAAVLLASVAAFRAAHEPSRAAEADQALAGRRLAPGHQKENEKKDGIEWPPEDFILSKPYAEANNKWMIIFHFIGIAYMLLGLNTVCDQQFTGSLEMLVQEWKIQPDVAGATFMAAGGSAPELFTSLIGATIAENDVGFGTIVGSAVFNVLFVIGLCGYVAKEPIKLSWWPLFRDCTYYIFALSVLAACSADNRIAIYEAIILFFCYVLYCVIMYFNPKLEELADFEFQKAKQKQAKIVPMTPSGPGTGGSEAYSADASTLGWNDASLTSVVPERGLERRQSSGDSTRAKPVLRTQGSMGSKARTSALLHQESAVRHDERMATVDGRQESGNDPEAGDTSALDDSVEDPSPKPPSKEPVELPVDNDEERKSARGGEEEEEEPGLLDMPEGNFDRVVWVLSLPVYVPISWGIPEPTERCFLGTFFVCLLWIAGFSFFLVWWVEVVGQVFGIKTLYMSFTLLAAGTSIPDAVSSMAVAKEGQGDMAVSSSIGSNIFDILVGLPIPWIIKIGFVEMIGHGQTAKASEVVILSEFITFYVLLLLIMVVLVVMSIHFMGWELSRPLGMCMAVLYVTFLVIALSVEEMHSNGVDVDFFKFKR